MQPVYGEPPVELWYTEFPEWEEFMHYLYLPVRLKGGPNEFYLPPNLEFLRSTLTGVYRETLKNHQHLQDPYVYVTLRRGYATPGNPLNRPGWHCDDFGGEDINYIWSDKAPTQFLVRPIGEPGIDLEIPEDDVTSMARFEELAANPRKYSLQIESYDECLVLELNPWVIHAAPEITTPGMRSFFKISFSNHKYNLKGNSHNHLLGYSWTMHDRVEVRNSTAERKNADYVVE